MKKDSKELLKRYLRDKQVMQLATVKDGQPWICNVHYVADAENNLYWISKPTRRHSQEIHEHAKAAIAIAVHSPEHPVVGIQMEGTAQKVEDSSEISRAMKLYDERYGVSKKFYDDMIAGTAADRLYKFIPRLIVLFDEEYFSDNPRQEWLLND